MEDEYMIKRDISTAINSASVADMAITSEINSGNVVVTLERLAQLELFEVGAVYAASVAGGSAALKTAVTHFLCIAIGKNVAVTTPTDKMVQFIGGLISGTNFVVNPIASGSDLITTDTAGVLTLSYYGNAAQLFDASGSVFVDGAFGYSVDNAGFGATVFAASDYMKVEAGGRGNAEGSTPNIETRKKVRRLHNVTQIFKESYTITGTQEASKMYGGPEKARLRVRKLKKVKTDIEYAMITQGAIVEDATAENPTRRFQGLGVGTDSLGVIKTFNGYSNSDLQLTASSATMDEIDALQEQVFYDQLNGTMTKLVYVSNFGMRIFNRIIREDSSSGVAVNVTMGKTGIMGGVRFTSFTGSIGNFVFVIHPLLNGGGLKNFFFGIDMANFDIRPLRTRTMQLRSNVVRDGQDGQTDEWLMEVGMEARNEQTHFIGKFV
jgi:hypothetical protein